MPLGELLFNLTDDLKINVRKIEKLNRKLSKAQNAVIFNGHCLNEDILPRYTNIYIYVTGHIENRAVLMLPGQY